MTGKRIGVFEIERSLIDHNPKAVMEALSQVLVIRAEALFHNDTVEYMALGGCFEMHVKGSIIRRYMAVFGVASVLDPETDEIVRLEVKFEGFK